MGTRYYPLKPSQLLERGIMHPVTYPRLTAELFQSACGRIDRYPV